MINKHFYEYDDVLNRINEVQSKIIEIREKIYSVKGIRYDEMPSGSTLPTDITYYLIELEELEHELEELKNKRMELRKNHELEIDKLDNTKHRSVLRMHYLMKLDIYKIADTLNLSVSHIRKIKKEASDEFMRLNDNKW